MLMMLTLAGLLVLLVSGLAAAPAGAGPALPLLPASAPQADWVLQEEYSDEFAGPELDLKKWDDDIDDWGLWSWAPENVRLENGVLKLRMQYQEHERGGKKLFYTSAAIRSKAPPLRYGFVEARIKTAPLYPGVSPAFWLYRNDPEVWTEMDFELCHANTRPQHRDLPPDQSVRIVEANSFVFRHPDLANAPAVWGNMKVCDVHPWTAPWDPRDDFHVYAIEWDQEQIHWYVDGQRVRSRQNQYWHQALDLIVSLGLRDPFSKKPSPEGFPTEFDLDYLRVWKKKTPELADQVWEK